MTANHISFIYPIPSISSLLLIIYNNEIIGSVEFSNDMVISNIDINPEYMDKVKKNLLEKLLFELGYDDIEVITENNNAVKYYQQFGFTRRYRNRDGKVFLKYCVKNRPRVQKIVDNIQSSLIKIYKGH